MLLANNVLWASSFSSVNSQMTQPYKVGIFMFVIAKQAEKWSELLPNHSEYMWQNWVLNSLHRIRSPGS